METQYVVSITTLLACQASVWLIRVLPRHQIIPCLVDTTTFSSPNQTKPTHTNTVPILLVAVHEETVRIRVTYIYCFMHSWSQYEIQNRGEGRRTHAKSVKVQKKQQLFTVNRALYIHIHIYSISTTLGGRSLV